MTLDEKDYILLEYISTFSEPKKFDYASLPPEIKSHFVAMPMTDPNSIVARLTQLNRYTLLDRNGQVYSISDVGKARLSEHQKKKEESQTLVNNQFKVVNLQIEDLTNKIKSFKPSNRRANMAIIISILSLLAAIVLGVLRLKGK